MLQTLGHEPNRATADPLVQDFIATYEPCYPAAVACLLDDLEASLAMLRHLRRELELEPRAPEPTSSYQKAV